MSAQVERQGNGPTTDEIYNLVALYRIDPESEAAGQIYDRLVDPGGLPSPLHDHRPDGLLVYLTIPANRMLVSPEPVDLGRALELIGVAIEAAQGRTVHVEIAQDIDL